MHIAPKKIENVALIPNNAAGFPNLALLKAFVLPFTHQKVASRRCREMSEELIWPRLRKKKKKVNRS